MSKFKLIFLTIAYLGLIASMCNCFSFKDIVDGKLDTRINSTKNIISSRKNSASIKSASMYNIKEIIKTSRSTIDITPKITPEVITKLSPTENEVKEVINPVKDEPPTSNNGELYIISSYDLSVQSCGKPRGSYGFGNTASGFNLVGHTRESAMTIAADTNRFPLGTKVYINFINQNIKHMSGIYNVRDTGGAIYGNKIDLFMGDFGCDSPAQQCYDFGVQKAYINKIN